MQMGCYKRMWVIINLASQLSHLLFLGKMQQPVENARGPKKGGAGDWLASPLPSS